MRTGAEGHHPPAAGRLARQTVLLLCPLVAGAAIMALELVGLRLLAPRFGASTYVWGALLGAVMAALAIGYLAGGSLADRRPRPALVFALMLVGAGFVVVDLLLADRVLAASDGLGPTWGPVLATTLLLGPAMLVLGSVSPFVVRLDANLASLGVRTGSVFALSTAGSLAGTFLAAFWLIPVHGSRATLRVVVVVLVLPAVIGLLATAGRRRRALPALLPAALALAIPDPPLPAGLLFAGESPYNTVFVEEQHGQKVLRLNHASSGFHSIRPAAGTLTGIYYDVFYLAPWLAEGRDVLVLGMAGGTTVRGYREIYPDARITAVEIDPLVVELARDHFGVAAGPGLEVRVADARRFLAEPGAGFDAIEIDLFAGGPYAPFYCLTREFFAATRGRLNPRGLAAVNVFAPSGDRALVDVVASTMATVFAAVHEVPLEHQSVMLGFREPISAPRLADLLAAEGLPPALRPVAARTRASLRPGARGGLVLTDDRAPVEPLTHAMIRRERRQLR